MSLQALLLLALLSLAAGAQELPPDPLSPEVARADIEAFRALKDSLLHRGEDSPLSAEQRQRFAGLDYFPVDLDYRLVGELHAYGRRRVIEVPTTDGTTQPVERIGRFAAVLRGKAFSLEVYRSLEDGVLQVFFRDGSTGQQTYATGRYAHLESLGDGFYLLDFNKAYNPYCAYNPDYVCPLPPRQNEVPLPILAGERNYGADLAH